MGRSYADVLGDLARSVVDMDAALARRAAAEALASGIDPMSAIQDGLTRGMDRVNELFEAEEYFVPEILLSSDAMYAGIEILKPHLARDGERNRRKVAIGVVQGDTHDIGKNLVRIMLDNAGFEVHDLGRDVAVSRFVDTAGDLGADIVCLSTLMTTTMDRMAEVIEKLRDAGLGSKVLVGGGPISPAFASRIGASGYGRNATEAVRVARSLFATAAEAAERRQEVVHVGRG